MNLKNLKLSIVNIALTTNTRTLDVLRTGKIHKRDTNGSITEAVESLYVECACRGGDSIKIKFPTEIESKITDLAKMLENDVTVSISFTGLKLTPYALKKADGTILSGVSGKATDFTIEKSISDSDILDVTDFDLNN